jgi:hypothetical protein
LAAGGFDRGADMARRLFGRFLQGLSSCSFEQAPSGGVAEGVVK